MPWQHLAKGSLACIVSTFCVQFTQADWNRDVGRIIYLQSSNCRVLGAVPLGYCSCDVKLQAEYVRMGECSNIGKRNRGASQSGKASVPITLITSERFHLTNVPRTRTMVMHPLHISPYTEAGLDPGSSVCVNAERQCASAAVSISLRFAITPNCAVASTGQPGVSTCLSLGNLNGSQK